ncbi:hypothetical protein D8S82_08410 [Mycobacterium hodleri]|uniref:Uncharacterized protein n=1 Tax=Mycolicibacterium hodleri TaxID=49897 RepID=A0A544W4A6_9MYCO|nr:hypothetical protein [Mycolicibacterium hodleri]TQR87070.1 hypothetical protein D8S82_08410 [Mycolicibacterium hodleri]
MPHELAAGMAQPGPPWSTALLALAGLWWLGFFVASFRTKELRVERRLYWLGHGGAAVLALSHRGWQAVLGGTGLVVFITLLYAVLNTPYLKIGDRLISASDSDRRRDERDRGMIPRPPALENYATSTPGAFWWILVCLTVISAICVALPAHPDWRSWVGVALVGFMAPAVGVLDGRGRFPVARGQWVPAALAALASIPLYGVPVVLYAAGYLLGRRLSVGYGRHAKRDVE